MILGSFNGWNIVQTPGSPAPQAIEFTTNDIVSASTSPFTGQQQIQDWQASYLEAKVTLPPLTHQQAQAWIAFLIQLRGPLNVFQLGDVLAAAPQGTSAGSPVVNGSNQTGYSLNTKGWTANAANVLLPGDWIQIGYRLYRNLNPASADANGNTALAIWPQLRESPADGAAIVTRNTQGLWRLKSNQSKWSATEAKIYGITFECREAI